MVDEDILQKIHALVAEEQVLRDSESSDPDRLVRLEEALDQCWDLLRQRRARREFGQDPADSSVRGVDTVERYQQ
jgi:Protein of unknown function (DUF2630)